MWATLQNLKVQLIIKKRQKHAMSMGFGLDKLAWRVILNMLEVIFQSSVIVVLVCSFNLRGDLRPRRQVDRYFLSTPGYNKGAACNFRPEMLKLCKVDQMAKQPEGECSVL